MTQCVGHQVVDVAFSLKTPSSRYLHHVQQKTKMHPQLHLFRLLLQGLSPPLPTLLSPANGDGGKGHREDDRGRPRLGSNKRLDAPRHTHLGSNPEKFPSPKHDPQQIPLHPPEVVESLSLKLVHTERKEEPGEGFSLLNQGLVPLNLEVVIALSEHAMAENLPPEPPPDLAAPDGRRSELTRTNLESSSVTVDHSKDFIHRNTNVAPRTAWTDEKHNSYLDALEASFIKQLHQSLGLPFWRSEQNTIDSNPSQLLPVNAGYSSDQFTFLRDGPWKKIKFERNQPLLHGAAGSHVVMESPRMRHFRCSGKPSTIPSADLKECNMFHSEGMPLRGKRIFSHGLTSSERQCLCHQCHQDAVGTMTEVSDQNFVDEDKEVQSTSLSRVKRLKMAISDASTEDQIVPSRIHFMAEISTASNPSSEGETIESFIFIETNLKSYLRES